MHAPRAPGTLRRVYVAVVGPGEGASREAMDDARAAGRLIAERGWVLLSGGRAAGVMAAAADGVAAGDGISVGLLPGSDRADAAPGLTLALPTGLGEARNAVLVTAADAVIGCGMSAGTLSELALALRAGRPTVLVRADEATIPVLAALGGGPLHAAATPEAAIEWLAARLARPGDDHAG